MTLGEQLKINNTKINKGQKLIQAFGDLSNLSSLLLCEQEIQKARSNPFIAKIQSKLTN